MLMEDGIWECWGGKKKKENPLKISVFIGVDAEKNETFREGSENICRNDKVQHPKGLVEAAVHKRECI